MSRLNEIQCCFNSDLSRVNLNDIQMSYNVKIYSFYFFLFWTWFNLNHIWQVFVCILAQCSYFSFISDKFQNGRLSLMEAARLSPSRNTTHSYECNCYVWCILIVSTSLFCWATSAVMNNSCSQTSVYSLYKGMVDLTLGGRKRHFQVQVQGNLDKMKRLHSIKAALGKNF